MTGNVVLSERVEALFRKSLERDLGAVVTFGPILAEVHRHDGSEPAIRVTIVYEGQAEETDSKTEAVARAASEEARGELGLESTPTWIFVSEQKYPSYLRSGPSPNLPMGYGHGDVGKDQYYSCRCGRWRL